MQQVCCPVCDEWSMVKHFPSINAYVCSRQNGLCGEFVIYEEWKQFIDLIEPDFVGTKLRWRLTHKFLVEQCRKDFQQQALALSDDGEAYLNLLSLWRADAAYLRSMWAEKYTTKSEVHGEHYHEGLPKGK
jgi:hypothetical protein